MPADYSFTDKDLSLNGSYTYRLKQIDYDGSFKYSEEVTINYTAAEVFQLYQNYPNPFNSQTTITFSLSEPSYIELVMYDILGNLIKTLVKGKIDGGSHKVSIDADDMASGIYFVKLVSEKSILARKIVLLI